jgi:hypothetical protein
VCDHVDVLSIIPGFCRNPLYIMIVLVPLFLDLPQECCEIFYIMVYYARVHACCWWKWNFPCIISWLLVVVEHYWTSASSKSSSTLYSTSISNSISSRYVVLRYLIILHEVILWLHIVVFWLHSFILLLNIIIWRWYLVKLRCNFPRHYFFSPLIGI